MTLEIHILFQVTVNDGSCLEEIVVNFLGRILLPVHLKKGQTVQEKWWTKRDMSLEAFLHLILPSPCPLKWSSKLNIVSMVNDTLTGKMGVQLILSVKGTVIIDTNVKLCRKRRGVNRPPKFLHRLGGRPIEWP